MKTLSISKTLIQFVIFLFTSSLQAQVTEHFTDETPGTSLFTNSSYTYNITGGRFVITHYVGYGYTGTGIDNDYVDNYGDYPSTAGVLGSITNLTNWFKVYELYIFPGATGDFVSNVGTVIIRGKHSGTTQFTHTVESVDINTLSYVTSGWTYVNLSAYSSYEIDQLEFEVTGSLRYLGIDAFKHLTTGVLPVELIIFNANVSKSNVILSWQTATEVNNYGFEIERSQNNNWEKVGFVEGHGNSNSPKDYSFSDKPTNGSDFKYRLKQIDFDGNFEFSPEIEVSLIVPQFSVKQNYPNPFNPSTKIEFSIPKSGNVKLSIFNAIGQEVAVLINENMEAGNHNFQFSSDNYQLSSGIYFYKVISGKYSETKKMILLR